jgi:hypothetical protein
MCSVWVDCIVSEVFMNSVLSAGINFVYINELPSYYLSNSYVFHARVIFQWIVREMNKKKSFLLYSFFALIQRRTGTQLQQFHCMISTTEQVCSDTALNDQWKSAV